MATNAQSEQQGASRAPASSKSHSQSPGAANKRKARMRKKTKSRSAKSAAAGDGVRAQQTHISSKVSSKDALLKKIRHAEHLLGEGSKPSPIAAEGR